MATNKVTNIIMSIGGSFILLLMAAISYFLVRNFESQDKVSSAVNNLNTLIEVHGVKINAYEQEKTFFMKDYADHKREDKKEHLKLQNKIWANEKCLIRLSNKER